MSTKTTKAGTTRKSSRKTTGRTPRKAAKKLTAKTSATTRTAAPKAETPKRPRDPRLPPAGTEIVRPYKGRDVKVTVLQRGFRWEGTEYRSISALASAITGAKSINGFFWLRLNEAKGGGATWRGRCARSVRPPATSRRRWLS